MQRHNMLVFAKARPPEIQFDRPQADWQWETRALADDFCRFECRSDGGNSTITIFAEIGGASENGVTPARIGAALRSIGKQPITVEINSPGGSYFDGIAIYNLLRRHEAPVTVQVLGIAASAASLIAMAGDRIEIAKNAEIMIHQASGITLGNSDDHLASASLLQKIDGVQADTYAARTGLDREELLAMMRKDSGGGTYITGAQAVEMGFADAIMDREAEMPVYADGSADFPQDLEGLDKLLAKELKMPRAERRKLYKAIKAGTPNAAEPPTRSAGPDYSLLIQTLTSR